MEIADNEYQIVEQNEDDNEINQLNESPRRNSPFNDGERSRSQSFDRRSDRRDYSRSRSPRNRNPLNDNGNTNSNSRERDYSRERQPRRNYDNNNRGRNNNNNNNANNDLGLKYKWEKTIYVSNIPYDVKWPDLKDLFKNKIGEIVFCEVFEKDGKSMGIGAIEFKNVSDAERAVEEMHQFEMNNRKISVRLDNEGYKTRKAKEMCQGSKQANNNNNSVNNGNNNNQETFLALNQAASLAALGFGGNQAANNTSSNLLGSLLGGSLGGTQNNQTNLLLNQLAQQLKVEGPVTSRIFVASLDYKVDERKIREVFSLAGKVKNVSLFRDRDGKSRGMAVIEYDQQIEALNAVAMFNSQVLNDRSMTVRFDTKPPREDDLKSPPKLPSGLKSIGMGLGLGGLNPLQKSASLDASTNFAVGLDALGALTHGLNSNTNVNSLSTLAGLAGLTTGSGGLGLSSLLGSLTTSNNNSKSNISKIFIKNIPFSWDERKLKEKFRQAGNIEYVEIKHRDGKSRGCGLIKFTSAHEAQKAVELFNESRFEGRTLDVKLDQMAN